MSPSLNTNCSTLKFPKCEPKLATLYFSAEPAHAATTIQANDPAQKFTNRLSELAAAL